MYINESRVTGNAAVSAWLGITSGALTGEKNGVRVKVLAYDALASDLFFLCSNASITRVGLASSVSEYVALSVPVTKRVLLDYTPITRTKAVKNEAKVRGMRRAHVMDGIALAVLFEWLERQMANETAVVSEWDVAEKLVEVKRRLFGDEFLVPSFETISASGLNGASYTTRRTSTAPIAT